ncbi:MAG: 4Fe-4S binding protein [Methanobacterium sp.]
MIKITIDHEKCGVECVDACPMEVLIIEDDKITIQNKEECSLCEVCMDFCPNEAVEVDTE